MKTDGGIKVVTDHGEEIETDVVLFATGKFIFFLIDVVNRFNIICKDLD